MSKSQFYLSECAQAASKSPMCFKLGAVMVKGGKVISSGFNHHRPHYDGAEVHRHGHRKPVSMHAEMHAIFSLTGMSPSFRKQVQGAERRVPQRAPPLPPCRTGTGGGAEEQYGQREEQRSPIPKGCTAPERRLSGAWQETENMEEASEASGIEFQPQQSTSRPRFEEFHTIIDRKQWRQQCRNEWQRGWEGNSCPIVLA
ncbi:hypothetical protein ACEPAH_2327 [Sanghuangporus vaninii]